MTDIVGHSPVQKERLCKNQLIQLLTKILPQSKNILLTSWLILSNFDLILTRFKNDWLKFDKI